jgi:hypothetical protein
MKRVIYLPMMLFKLGVTTFGRTGPDEEAFAVEVMAGPADARKSNAGHHHLPWLNPSSTSVSSRSSVHTQDSMAPAWAQQPDGEPRRPRRRLWHVLPLLAGMGLVYQALQATTLEPSKVINVPLHAQETLAKCRSLNVTPGPPDNFHSRKVSDRFARGTKPVLLRDAQIWTVRNTI